MRDEMTQTQSLLLTQDNGEIAQRRWTLSVVSGPDQGKEVSAEAGTLLIGTHANNELTLTDSKVSRRHLEASLYPEGVHIVDLGSKNGSFVQEKRVDRWLVPPGGRVRIGQSELLFTAQDRTLESGDLDRLGGFVSRAKSMKRLLHRLKQGSQTDATILLEGETGTGKEVLARAIHDCSQRSKGPFVVVDCGAVQENLLESQLFGHRKGAFTGAINDHQGAFEAGNNGTVFLDELGELPLQLQPKLLRALESRTITRVGESKERPIDVRFVAATHRQLKRMAKEGKFRSDLYYRVAVVHFVIPPLRDRPEDVALLAERFAGVPMGAAALRALDGYDWPGNVRELRNVVERAMALCDGELLRPEDFIPEQAPAETFLEAKEALIHEFEERYVRALLNRHQGNVSKAAREAGLSRNALYGIMKRVGLG